MRTNEPRLRVGLKYCGGCNPNYDRVALAQEIKERLKGTVQFVPWDSPGISLILVMHGCPTACADLEPFKKVPVFTITGPQEADGFVHTIRERVCQPGLIRDHQPAPLPGCHPGRRPRG